MNELVIYATRLKSGSDWRYGYTYFGDVPMSDDRVSFAIKVDDDNTDDNFVQALNDLSNMALEYEINNLIELAESLAGGSHA